MKESEKLTTYSRKDVIDRLAETRDFENADHDNDGDEIYFDLLDDDDSFSDAKSVV